jgi:hypothetical protein
MLQGLILIDALSSACWEKKGKKKEKRSNQGHFFPQGWRLDTPCWLCQARISWLVGAIKG